MQQKPSQDVVPFDTNSTARYVIPNLITLLAICAGLTAIRFAFESKFSEAVLMVLLAGFCDATDGRIARVMRGSSPFGAQMDSLADVLNFGAAPALLLYVYLLQYAKAFGWIAVLLYCAACCLRLARFNVMLENKDNEEWQKNYFIGVPAPAAALLVLFPLFLKVYGLVPDKQIAYLFCLYTVIISFLMVSRIPVWNGKNLSWKFKRDWGIFIILLLVAYAGFLATYTWQSLAATSCAYLLFLPISCLMYQNEKRKHKKAKSKIVHSSKNVA